MQTATIADFIRQWDSEDGQYPTEEDTVLYRFRDGKLVFYIGITLRGVNIRLSEHFGLEQHAPSPIGRLFHRMLPYSVEWSVDLYTTDELRKYVRRTMIRQDKPAYMWRHIGEWSSDSVARAAEVLMIARDRPCLNIHSNLNPKPLPAKYRM